MIYYIRQPDKKKEEYYVYQNTSLTIVGEVLHGIIDDWNKAVTWMKSLYANYPDSYPPHNWFNISK